MSSRNSHQLLYFKRDNSAVTLRAPAKINWTLRVLGRRPDGYHELESLVSPVSLYDDLSFSVRPEPGVKLICGAPGVPLDESNLVVRAVRRVAELAGIHAGVECRLEKRIPVGGGLGGGSSNAASTLVALNALWRLNWSRQQLASVGAELGSDVPLFLHGGPVIMTGRGERIRPAELGWWGWVVLVFPGIPVSTAAVYESWREAHPSGSGGQTDTRPPEWFANAPSGAVEWMEWTYNMLEAPAMKVCPALEELMRRLTGMANRPMRLSGSGSTLFTAFDEPGEADRFAAAVTKEVGLEAGVVRPTRQAEA